MNTKKPYVAPIVMGAQYGFGFMPVNRGVFSKNPDEKIRLKWLKQRAVNKGKMKTVVAFTCNKTTHGTFGGKQKSD